MKIRSAYLLIAAVLAAGLPAELNAQPKAFGMSFSFNNIGITYEHFGSEGNFTEFALNAKFSEMFLGRQKSHGGDASFTWNMKIGEFISSEGNPVTFFAGPGAVAGWGADFKKIPGIYVGIKGRIGAECSFSRRRVTISAYAAPVLGAHITESDDSIKMDYYRNGLIYSLIPEIGIKYRF